MKRLALISLCLLVCNAALADPLSDLLAKGDGSACFSRSYDDAHLEAHPKQETVSAVLSLKKFKGGAVIRIRFETRDGYRVIYGGCSWENRANLDINDQKLIKAFRGPSGLDCHAMTDEDGSSAEEGGDFPVDLLDGTSIMLYMPESLAAWPSYDRKKTVDFVDFSAEDRIFKLGRTSTSDCGELVAKLPSLE